MTERTASCRCGQLSLIVTGEPIRVSVCHCRDCQKRSGSAFAAQARFPCQQVTVTGKSKALTRTSDSGNAAEFHFCPECGSDVFFHSRPQFDAYAVPLGTFAPGHGLAPRFSVFETRRY